MSEPTPPAAPETSATAQTPQPSAISSRVTALQKRLARLEQKLTPQEQLVAELFVRYRNKIQAWREAYQHEDRKATSADYNHACAAINKPDVLRYIRELESIAAANVICDVEALLRRDLAIVEAADHANDLSRIVYTCCRYCFGKDGKYQWVDFAEYLDTLSKAEEANEARRERKVREVKLPTDEGGYGYDPQLEPNMTCVRCEGAGQMRTIWADTTKLGPAAPLFRGIKQGANGQLEILMHDVDKAKERLLKAAGVFKDDAASVARGAAAGAAAGAAVAATQAGAARAAAGPMSVEEAQRLYLELAG